MQTNIELTKLGFREINSQKINSKQWFSSKYLQFRVPHKNPIMQ